MIVIFHAFQTMNSCKSFGPRRTKRL